jgi:hypothetical protein
LASSIPNLKLNFALLQGQTPKSEIDPDCCAVVLYEVIVCKSHQHAGLAYTTVPQQHYFEQIVVFPFPTTIFHVNLN